MPNDAAAAADDDDEHLGTVRPLYRTGVSLLSRERFLYIYSTNIFHYRIFA